MNHYIQYVGTVFQKCAFDRAADLMTAADTHVSIDLNMQVHMESIAVPAGAKGVDVVDAPDAISDFYDFFAIRMGSAAVREDGIGRLQNIPRDF